MHIEDAFQRPQVWETPGLEECENPELLEIEFATLREVGAW